MSARWFLKTIFVAVLVVLPSSAEDIGFHNGGLGTDGRSYSNPLNSFNNLNSLSSSCGVGRPGINLGGGGSFNVPPAGSQSAFVGDNGGILQASVPPGAVGSTANAGASPRAALFASKCLSCHDPLPASRKRGKEPVDLVRDGQMPPNGGLSEQERADIVTFLSTGN